MEEIENMPIWQNHEQRITTLEVITGDMQREFKEVKEIINKGNKDQTSRLEHQTDRLEQIDKRLMEEFFQKARTTRDNVWKLVFKIGGGFVGAGSFIYILIEKLM